jgi:putative transposase
MWPHLEDEAKMKKSKFSESQIVAILKEAEAGVPSAEVARRHGISAATLYAWKSKYAGVTVSELSRIRELEAENAKLKRMYADLALENTAMKDVISRKW